MTEEKIAKAKSSLPSPIELAKETWEIYKLRFWTLVGIGLVGFVAILLLLIILGVIGAILFFVLGAKPSPQIIGIEALLVVIFIIGAAVLGQWLTGAALLSIINSEKKEGIREFISDAKPFILPLLGTTILLGFLSLGAFFLFVIPLFVFTIWFFFFRYVVLTDGHSGLSALHISRQYVKGRFWGILWRMIAVNLPMFIIGLLFIRAGRPGPIHGLYQLVSLLLVPFYTIYYYVLFTHVKKLIGKIDTKVSGKSKLVYLLIPILGYVLVIVTGIIVVPTAIKLFSSLSAGIPGNGFQGGGGQTDINPSTGIVYGLTTYYISHKEFPESLQVLVQNHTLTTIPDDTKTGLPYTYTVEKKGQDFKLCTPISVKPEKCVTSASSDFSL